MSQKTAARIMTSPARARERAEALAGDRLLSRHGPEREREYRLVVVGERDAHVADGHRPHARGIPRAVVWRTRRAVEIALVNPARACLGVPRHRRDEPRWLAVHVGEPHAEERLALLRQEKAPARLAARRRLPP